jgi:hypothetical protein
MTTTSKRPLISESVTAIRIGVHYAGEEPNQHVVGVAPRVSHMTTFHEVPTKSKSGPCSRDKVLVSVIIQPGCHPGLPHSPSTKPPQSKEGWFNKAVTKLLGLPGPIKPDMQLVQIKAYPPGPK